MDTEMLATEIVAELQEGIKSVVEASEEEEGGQAAIECSEASTLPTRHRTSLAFAAFPGLIEQMTAKSQDGVEAAPPAHAGALGTLNHPHRQTVKSRGENGKTKDMTTPRN